MAIHKISLRPGVQTQASPTLNAGGISSSNLIRFHNGFLEKIGGWMQLISQQVVGIARGLHAFQDLNNIDYLAIGSEQRLEIYSNGIITDITPIRKTSNIAPSFSTTNGQPTVKITDTSNGVSQGDWINIYTYVSVGGVLLLGFYRVVSVIDGNNYNITAASNATSTVSNTGAVSEFSTTNTQSSVKVTLNNHGFVIGNPYTIQISTTVGGLTLSGVYVVATVINANNFTINAAGSATSTTSAYENSGDASIYYLLPSGSSSNVILSGYGVGGYGEGAYGESSSSTYLSPLRNWYLDNFGQNLVALPTNGTLYQWVPPVTALNTATAVSNAPLYGAGMFVAMPQAQVVILGAETGGAQDPLLVRWCDNGNITDWTATVTNQAGSYRLSRGSKIIGGLQGTQFGFIWTDIDLWVMNYQGYPLVYGFNIVGESCGLIAPKAAALQNALVMWVSLKGFFSYSSGGSGVQPVPCNVWDEVFPRLDTNNLTKAFLASNSLFNEFMFFFPSTDSTNPTPGEIDSYAKVNIVDGNWDYGSLVRYSWIDESIFGNPVAIDGNNLIEQHEVGYDANGVPMTGVFAQTGYIDISDGTIFMFVDWLIPDFVWKTTESSTIPSVTITIYTQYYPGDQNPLTVGPFTITPTTQYISFRTRARQMAIMIESNAMDTFWRIGAIRYRSAPAGRV